MDTIRSTPPTARKASSLKNFTTAPRENMHVVLPMPPEAGVDTRFEMEIYARFMRHLRDVPNSRMEIKVLAAIEFTSGTMNVGDALVAKTLVDLGLRAPRRAFPGAFLDFADRALMRTLWANGAGAPAAIQALREHWQGTSDALFMPLTAPKVASVDPVRV